MCGIRCAVVLGVTVVCVLCALSVVVVVAVPEMLSLAILNRQVHFWGKKLCCSKV